MAKLEVYRGRKLEFNFYLENDSTVVGRGDKVDIPLDSDVVSRRHMSVKKQGASYIAEDIGGKNGVFVNGKWTNLHILQDGDKIEIGPYALFFRQTTEEKARELFKHRGETIEASDAFKVSKDEVEKALDAKKFDKATAKPARVSGAKPTAFMAPVDLENLRANLETRRAAHLSCLVDGERKEFMLPDGPVFIGWKSDSFIPLPGARFFAMTAAKLEKTDAGWTVSALTWWRPVRVAGARIQSHTLANEETFEIGGVKIRFYDEMK